MDNKNLIKYPKKIRDAKIYQHHIDRVWNLMKDASKYTFFDKGIKDVTFIIGTNSFEVGNTFSCKFAYKTVTYKVERIINKEHFRQLKLRCIKSSANETYDLVITLHKISSDDNTLLLFELSFDQQYYVTIEQYKHLWEDRKGMLNQIGQWLDQDCTDLYQYESIIIKAKRPTVWDIVTDWRRFRGMVPIIADEIAFEGNPLSLGTKIEIGFSKKNAKCSLTVEEVSCEEEAMFWSYTMLCYDGVPKPPKQKINFLLYSIDENTVLVEFKHTFLEPIKYEVMKIISSDKKMILEELRRNLERGKNNE